MPRRDDSMGYVLRYTYASCLRLIPRTPEMFARTDGFVRRAQAPLLIRGQLILLAPVGPPPIPCWTKLVAGMLRPFRGWLALFCRICRRVQLQTLDRRTSLTPATQRITRRKFVPLVGQLLPWVSAQIMSLLSQYPDTLSFQLSHFAACWSLALSLAPRTQAHFYPAVTSRSLSARPHRSFRTT